MKNGRARIVADGQQQQWLASAHRASARCVALCNAQVCANVTLHSAEFDHSMLLSGANVDHV